jgi:predicted nuclease of restriction endonuclease-like (RecB) superfamily
VKEASISRIVSNKTKYYT